MNPIVLLIITALSPVVTEILKRWPALKPAAAGMNVIVAGLAGLAVHYLDGSIPLETAIVEGLLAGGVGTGAVACRSAVRSNLKAGEPEKAVSLSLSEVQDFVDRREWAARATREFQNQSMNTDFNDEKVRMDGKLAGTVPPPHTTPREVALKSASGPDREKDSGRANLILGLPDRKDEN